MNQNWNNVLIYVKANLGTKSSDLEITDDEFVTYFKEITLPYFSQIIPLHAWSVLSNSNLVNIPHFKSRSAYEIKLEEFTIIDVSSVYLGHSSNSMLQTIYTANPADIVMANTLNDMVKFLNTFNDYEFIKPNYIRFSEVPRNNMFIVELNVEHNDCSTIPSDMYHKLFRQMCLVDGLELILHNRNKFTNITTPFGNIDLNFDYIQQRVSDLRRQNEEMIDYLPHREYLEIF